MKHALSITLPSILLLVITGCSSSSDSTSTPAVKGVDISSLGSTVTVTEADLFNLTVSGLNNTVTVTNGNKINDFSLSGLNNMITIEANVSINSFTASGSDNTVIVPIGSGITFSDSGLNNTLIEQ